MSSNTFAVSAPKLKSVIKPFFCVNNLSFDFMVSRLPLGSTLIDGQFHTYDTGGYRTMTPGLHSCNVRPATGRVTGSARGRVGDMLFYEINWRAVKKHLLASPTMGCSGPRPCACPCPIIEATPHLRKPLSGGVSRSENILAQKLLRFPSLEPAVRSSPFCV
jgi:hypothetical protein